MATPAGAPALWFDWQGFALDVAYQLAILGIELWLILTVWRRALTFMEQSETIEEMEQLPWKNRRLR